MSNRPPALYDFVAALQTVLRTRRHGDAKSRKLRQFFVNAVEICSAHEGIMPAKLPVCAYLSEAFDLARSSKDESVVRLADSLSRISDELLWECRGGPKTDDSFFNGHANANILGAEGLEQRDDLWVGVTLMAPGVQYPLHRHPPDEIYIVLSAGDWLQGERSWLSPGIGGIVHNDSNVLHAMRSTAKLPLLAIWCLTA